MSYLPPFQYKIMPTTSFPVIRNCPGCGCKTRYESTGCFRVNANGNKLDVWLIYQCETCKHTYNLTIYERKRPNELTKKERDGFLQNSSALAFQYGTSIALFAKNKAVIDWNALPYEVQRLGTTSSSQTEDLKAYQMLHIENPYQLKVRKDKILGSLLGISRSSVKRLMDKGTLRVTDSPCARQTMVLSDTALYNA